MRCLLGWRHHERDKAAAPCRDTYDGRYASKVTELQDITSEYGLIKRRVGVEVGWLATLGSGVLPDVEPFSDDAVRTLTETATGFAVEDAEAIKAIEKTTNHDVKAVEVWLRQRFANNPELADRLELIHFSATSEDINNLAYAMMVRDVRDRVLMPRINGIAEELFDKAEEYAEIPMLGHTHGQPATPTTMGKELAVFGGRLDAHASRLSDIAIYGKFNGATGNYNAAAIAYPEVNWPAVNAAFVRRFGFEVQEATTQIEPHDWIAAFCNELSLGNRVMTDIAQDAWLYIFTGYFKQKIKEDEVSSSTMPHKVNPIDFENAEANFGVANALLRHLAEKLPVSRMQRDLSDSSTLRTLGTAFGHTAVAHASLGKGLGKIYPDEHRMANELRENWVVLAEAVQTVARRYGVENPYDILKAASRGKVFDQEAYAEVVESLDIPHLEKVALLGLRPATYTGYAAKIARGDDLTREQQAD